MLPPHSEPATWPGYTSTSSPSAASRSSEREEVLGALARGDREIGPRCIADEERVAGQHELVVDDERAVLGPVAGRVQDADLRRTCAHDLAVGQRLVRVLGFGERVDRDGEAVLDGEPAVARDVVGVGVRLENALDPTCSSAAASTYCSIASAGSTTTATAASRSPTRYEAHPRSSSTNWRKTSTAA